MAEFNVMGTKFVVTDMNFTAVTGSKEWVGLFNQVKVDLTKPDADNLLVFAKVPEVASGMSAYGAVQAKATALIALCQDQLNREVEAMTGTMGELTVNGTYSCADAKYMLFVAQIVRQQSLGEADLWPLGPMELSYLLTRSAIFQALVADAIKQANVATAEQTAAYQHSIIAFPATQAPGMSFYPAQVPESCEGKRPPVMPPVTPGSMCAAGTQFDAATGTCLTAVGYEQTKKTSGWVMPVAVGLGVIGAGALVYHFSRRDARADLKRVTG